MKNASYALAAETCISHTLTKVLRLASVFIKRDLRSKQALLDRPRWFMFMVAVGGNSKREVSRGYYESLDFYGRALSTPSSVFEI